MDIRWSQTHWLLARHSKYKRLESLETVDQEALTLQMMG
tara:strand:+ start:584 stop:700 length:117 start_codon:yes stop_codon:yes gene_type:complete